MIIGLSGKKQTGKDTICNIIRALNICERADSWIDKAQVAKLFYKGDVALNDSVWSKHAFADPLKKMACVLTGFPDASFFESSRIKNTLNATFGVTNREILQILGQGLRDNLCEDVWVKMLVRDYHLHNRPNWIVTDIRMPNELEAIKKLGGIVIRVNRNTGYSDNHISETALDNCTDFDYVIDNNGTIEELIQKVIPIYNKINYESRD